MPEPNGELGGVRKTGSAARDDVISLPEAATFQTAPPPLFLQSEAQLTDDRTWTMRLNSRVFDCCRTTGQLAISSWYFPPSTLFGRHIQGRIFEGLARQVFPRHCRNRPRYTGRYCTIQYMYQLECMTWCFASHHRTERNRRLRPPSPLARETRPEQTMNLNLTTLILSKTFLPSQVRYLFGWL